MFDRRPSPARTALALVSLGVGVLVFLVATEQFPHHSSNHDEAVYLLQAEMLLDGKLWFYSSIPDAVRPWFFVQDGTRLYPKYSPVPAAVFALGVLVDVPRLSLALVAIANTALVGLLTAEAFDQRTGVVAAVLLVTSPLFLLQSSLFLPYAPTMAFNLAFAFAYVRAWRTEEVQPRRRYSALAGAAIGIAFFARPYTAVLFALPFIAHTFAAGVVSWRADREETDQWFGIHRPIVERSILTGAVGLVFVGIALLYNAVVTGSPLVFPYQVFAPMDGPGFGTRQILGYERTYTPELALRANYLVLEQLLTNWTPAAPLGTVATAVGLGVFLARVRGEVDDWSARTLSPTQLRAVVAGLFVSIPVGNVFFWGNLNVLAALDDPTDGLIALVGPFYHFDLLLPFAMFGAVGLVAAGQWLASTLDGRVTRRTAQGVLAVVVVVSLVAGGMATTAAVSAPLDRNQPYTDRYERAYQPFENRTFDRALVFVPTPYGDWLNHPFQSLRNGPDVAGPAVYALDRNASGDFRTVDAFPNRTLYRYTYRGQWTPGFGEFQEPIVATVDPMSVHAGPRQRIQFAVGRVVGAETATVRIAGPHGAVQYGVETLPGETLAVNWTVGKGYVTVDQTGLTRYSDQRAVGFDGAATLSMTVTFTQASGSTVTYRQDLSVEETEDGVRVLWPPETSVCRLVTDCGNQGTYIAGADDYPTGVSVSQDIETLPAANKSYLP